MPTFKQFIKRKLITRFALVIGVVGTGVIALGIAGGIALGKQDATGGVTLNTTPTSASTNASHPTSTSASSFPTSKSTSSSSGSLDLPSNMGCSKQNFVPYQTKYVNDDSLPKGQQKTVVSGEDGYTYACQEREADGTIKTTSSSTSAPISAVVDVGTGIDAEQQELEAKNAAIAAHNSCVQSVIAQSGGRLSTAQADSMCP